MLSEEEVLRRRAELEERRALKRRYRRRQIIFYSVFFAVGIIIMVLTARFTYYRQVAVTRLMGLMRAVSWCCFWVPMTLWRPAPERIRSCSYP